MAGEFVRARETLLAARKSTDKRLFAGVRPDVAGLGESSVGWFRRPRIELTWCSRREKALPQRT